MWRKVWSFLLALSAVTWFINAIQVVVDPHYHIDKFSLFIALIITSGVVAGWAIEEWQKSEK